MVLEIEKKIFHAILLQNNIYSDNEFQSYVNNHKLMSDKEAAENLKKIWQNKVIEKATTDPDYWIKQYEFKNNITTEKQKIRYECKVCSSTMSSNCNTCQTKNVEECVYVNESHAINMSLLIDYYLFSIEIVAKGTQLNRIKNQIKGFSFFDRDLDDEKDGIFSIEDLKMMMMMLNLMSSGIWCFLTKWRIISLIMNNTSSLCISNSAPVPPHNKFFYSAFPIFLFLMKIKVWYLQTPF